MLFAAVAAAVAPLGSAHAYLKFPPLRGGTKGSTANAYCPQCGNGAGVCGDGGQWSANSNYLNYKGGERTDFAPGEEVEFEVYVTAHHMGYFEFGICEKDVDSSTANPQDCFDKHKLKRVGPPEGCTPNDDRGDCQPVHAGYPERWYLPPGVGSHLARFTIPEDLQCSSCTLQWRWWTANSCQPASDAGCYFESMRELGWDADKWCKGFCGSCPSLLQANTSRAAESGCGEEFRNCADISVGQGDGPSVTSPETPTEPVSEEDEPEAEAEAEPEVTTPSAEGRPAACGSCGVCLWSSGQCYTDASQSYCESWPDNLWCGAGSLAQIASPGTEHREQRQRKTNKGGTPTFLGPSLLQDGASVSHVAMSSDRAEEL